MLFLAVDHPLKFSRIFELFPFEVGLSQKYYSTLEAVAMMKVAGANLGDRGVNHIYKQYLKSLRHIGNAIGKSLNDVLHEFVLYLEYVNSPNLELKAEIKFLEKHERAIAGLHNLVKRVGLYLWSVQQGKSPKERINDPKGMIENYMKQHGIRRSEVEDILSRLARFNIL